MPLEFPVSIHPTITSPRLRTLEKSLESGEAKALTVFWEEVQQSGTPLIEPLPDDSDHSLVTFLWQGQQLRDVALISLLTEPTTHPLLRLAGSDVWYLSCQVRNDIRATYQFFPEPDELGASVGSDPQARWARYRPDPHNPHTFAFYDQEEDPTGVRLTRSVLAMPSAPSQKWIEPQPGTPQGQVIRQDIRSEILDDERRLWIYTPPGYAPGEGDDYPLVVFFDGWGYLKLIPTTTILDNLLAEKRIPPVIAMLLDSPDAEKRLQEMVFHPPHNHFLVEELLPWFKARYPVSDNPEKIVLVGSSAGGLAAAFAALEYPQFFGNVLSQSGAFTLAPDWEVEPEGLARRFAHRERQPLRFYLEAGLLERRSLLEGREDPSLLTANRHLRDVLIARGYPVEYNEFSGGHDYISWQGTLADGLMALLN